MESANGTSQVMATTPPAEPTPAVAFDLQGAWAFLRRRWRLGIGVCLITIVGAALASYLMPPVYSATCLVLYEGASPLASGRMACIGANLLGLPGGQQSLATQAAIILSPVVAKETWDELHPEQQAKLQEEFRVRVLRDTQLLEITTYGTDPAEVSAYANALADRYLSYRAEQERKTRDSTLNYLNSKLEKVREDLRRAQLDMKEFQEQNLGLDLTTRASALVSQVSAIESERRAAEVQLAARQAELNAALNRRVTLEGDQFRSTDLATNPVVTSLRQQLASLKQEQVGVLQVYTETSPEAQRIQARIDQVTAQLQRAARQAVAEQVAGLQSTVWVLQAQVSALRSAGQQARSLLEQLPEKQFQMAELELRVRTLTQTYELIANQYEVSRLAEQEEISQARIIVPAEVPPEPERPDLRVNLALGLAMGLILALAVTVLAEHLDDRVRDLRQLAALTDAPVLAVLPYDPRHSGALATSTTGVTDLAKELRKLRTAVMIAQHQQGLRSLVVASPLARDGRTFVAVNLGLELGQSGLNVLLVDADALDPQLATQFAVADEPGLTAVLAGEAQPGAAVRETPAPALKLMPWGQPDPAGAQALNIDRIGAILPELEQQYDLVLIDTPAASLAADVQAWAHQTDGALLVISLGQTRGHALRELVQHLQRCGAHVLGVVLNRA